MPGCDELARAGHRHGRRRPRDADRVARLGQPRAAADWPRGPRRRRNRAGAIIFPRYRGDLLECAVLARRMREAQIESTVVPRNALDVLAQHIVSAAVERDEEGERPLTVRGAARDRVRQLQLRRALARAAGERARHARRPLPLAASSASCARASPGTGSRGPSAPRRGARQLAITNAGTIPDRGLFAVTLPDGRRVGEFDEEMVHEARVGQTFLLGASSWRIEEIGRDRVIVTPAPGVPGAVPFWRGDTLGRPRELGQPSASSAARRSSCDEQAPARLPPRAARGAQPHRVPRERSSGDARDPERPHARAGALP